jgi:hypothetical protein
MMSMAKTKSPRFRGEHLLARDKFTSGVAALLARGSCSPDTTKYIVSDLQTTTDSQSYVAVLRPLSASLRRHYRQLRDRIIFRHGITANVGNVLRVTAIT